MPLAARHALAPKGNVMQCDGKSKRMGYTRGTTASFKKAIVTLTKDSKTIEFFDGLM